LSENIGLFETTAIDACMAGFDVLKHYFSKKNLKMKKKGAIDLVTEADTESEKTIIKIIKNNFPDHSILAEESGYDKSKSPFRWIIDPLDGTTNFSSGLPIFAISIALYKNDSPLLGIIGNPCTGDIYTGIKGKGSFLNKNRLTVSSTENILDSLIVTGFPYNLNEIIDEVKIRFFNVAARARGVRRLGSAALDLCFIASGIFEAFFEQNLKPWDTAAGIIIAEEAGAKITDFSGEKFSIDKNEILCTNSKIHNTMISLMEVK